MTALNMVLQELIKKQQRDYKMTGDRRNAAPVVMHLFSFICTQKETHLNEFETHINVKMQQLCGRNGPTRD